jgi:tRNA(Ile2) C34 agmatinyltransferase TiaS
VRKVDICYLALYITSYYIIVPIFLARNLTQRYGGDEAKRPSCVRRQPKVEWSARLGAVRLSSNSPWEQERRIVGMVKSPVEGSSIVLLKMDRPIAAFSDFVRPICLPSSPVSNATQCNTLGWAKNRK